MIMSFILYIEGHNLPQVRPKMHEKKNIIQVLEELLLESRMWKVKFGKISIKQKKCMSEVSTI